jgi:carbon monoxide dehydrogenase subunit G
MIMNFDNRFSVPAPIDEVWRTVLDVERVAPCVPGAQVRERRGDNAYNVAIKIKLGPLSMTYTGDVEIVETDEAAHLAVMSAKAREARGQGMADATVQMRLTEEDGRTQGQIHSDVTISGKAASMGRGVIGDVSARLVDTFAQNLASMLSGAPEPAPAPAAQPAAAAGETPLAAEPAPQPAAAPKADEGLPVASIAAGVAADRLRDPRALLGALAVVAVVSFLLGRRSAQGRRR